MFAADFLAGAGAELRAGDAADHQDQRQHGIDQMVGGRVQDGCEHHGDQGEHHRGADHGRGRHPQQIDHDRDQDEAAADAHHRADEADDDSDRDYGNDRQVDLGALEPQFQRQAVNPAMASGPARRRRNTAPCPQDCTQAFPEHHCADRGQQDDIGQRDHQIELTERAHLREGPHPERGADHAAAQQHDHQQRIDGAASPVEDRAGKRRGGDVTGHRGNRDRGRDADKDQKWRHQEAAADPEHARYKANRCAHRQQEKDIDRNIGDWEKELHARLFRNEP